MRFMNGHSLTPRPGRKGGHSPAGPGVPSGPFDPTRLPLLTRKRIGRPPIPPITPPRSTRSTASSSSRPTTPALAPTSDVRSQSSVPSSARSCPSIDASTSTEDSILLTPLTPLPHILAASCQTAKADLVSPGSVWHPGEEIDPYDRLRHTSPGSPSPSIRPIRHGDSELSPETPELVDEDEAPAASPIIVQHFSSIGGPASALQRFRRASLRDFELSGLSLFLFCPKRRTSFWSDDQMVKQMKEAQAWRCEAARQGMCHSITFG